jgi:hypothetical protein
LLDRNRRIGQLDEAAIFEVVSQRRGGENLIRAEAG